MKIKNVAGEFAFKALMKYNDTEFGWHLSEAYYFTKAEALSIGFDQVIWPVEVWEDGSVYIPAQEELA